MDICITDFDFNGNYLKLRCAHLQICTSNLYFIFAITLKPQLTQILKHKQLKYRFRSLHVRAADKNVYLLITLIHDVNPSQLSGASHCRCAREALLDARRDMVTHRATTHNSSRNKLHAT